MSKGQVFTVDVLFAFVVFITILIFFFQVQSDVTTRSTQMQTQYEDMHRMDKAVSALLFHSDDSIGLLDSTRRFVKQSSLDSFYEQMETNYSQIQKLLGLGGQDFFVQTYIVDGSSILLYNESGNFTVSNSLYREELLFSLENKSTIKFIFGVVS